MSSLTVRVVGVGDAFTCRYHNACLLLESSGVRLLVDAPPALARALADLSRRSPTLPTVGLDDIDHVLITHLHGDHVGGLEQLLFFRRLATQRRTRLYAIPQVIAGLWDTRLSGGMSALIGVPNRLTLQDYADVFPLGPGTTAVGDLSVEWRPTIHHIPTSAIRVRAHGKTVGYSADTSFDPTLIAWLDPSDVIFHETNVGVHTPLAALVGLPEETRARMRLIHYPDAHDVTTSPIACAEEGQAIEV